MRENRTTIITGFIVLLLVGGLIYWFQQRNSPTLPEESPTPVATEDLEERFNLEIPDDVEKIVLEDTADIGGTGIATRKTEDDRFTMTMLADLPDPEVGVFYQGWIQKGDMRLSVGRFSVAKGGFVLEFSANADYSTYNTVIISRESQADKEMEEELLRGSF